uniref:Uncharacterized protein n=1 Tax=Tupiella akineta TaxID=160070 RepID=Q6UVU9_TUPAK|nr:hypothetical protein PsakpMp13 [Tupiella akineta]AAQ18725.1 hypothetical protein [Tupiella akineta]
MCCSNLFVDSQTSGEQISRCGFLRKAAERGQKAECLGRVTCSKRSIFFCRSMVKNRFSGYPRCLSCSVVHSWLQK